MITISPRTIATRDSHFPYTDMNFSDKKKDTSRLRQPHCMHCPLPTLGGVLPRRAAHAIISQQKSAACAGGESCSSSRGIYFLLKLGSLSTAMFLSTIASVAEFLDTLRSPRFLSPFDISRSVMLRRRRLSLVPRLAASNGHYTAMPVEGILIISSKPNDARSHTSSVV